MRFFECKCRRANKVEEPPNIIENVSVIQSMQVIEADAKELYSIEEVSQEVAEEVTEELPQEVPQEVPYGKDKEIDAKLVKRLEELLTPYLAKSSLSVIRIIFNKCVYLEENLIVNITNDELISIIGELIKKHSVNKFASYFNETLYFFKKRTKLIRFRKNKKYETKTNIIEYHLDKNEHNDVDKQMLCIEEKIESAK